MRYSQAYGTGYVFKQKYHDSQGNLKEAKTYMIAYPHEGKERREATGTKVYKKAVAMLQERLAGKNVPEKATRHRVTLDDLFDLLKADYHQQKRRTFDQIELYRWPQIKKIFADVDVRTIDETELVKYADKRTAAGANNASINRERSALLRAMNLARQRKLIVSVPRVGKLKENTPRKGFFEHADFLKILDVLPEWWHDLFWVTYISGWRVQDELLPLKWSQVDFRHRFLRLEPGTTKNDDGRMFPFTQEMENALKRQRARVDALEQRLDEKIEWVFPRYRRGLRCYRIYDVFKKAATAVGMRHKMPHDFRRTAVRNLELAGVDRASAMQMVGHRTESIYRRYNIVDSRRIEISRQRLNAYEQQFKQGES